MPPNPDPHPSDDDLDRLKSVMQGVTYHLRHIARLGHAPDFDVETEWRAVNVHAWDLGRLVNQIWLRRAKPTKANSTPGVYQGYRCLNALVRKVYPIAPELVEGRQMPRTQKVDAPGGHADLIDAAVASIEEGMAIHVADARSQEGELREPKRLNISQAARLLGELLGIKPDRGRIRVMIPIGVDNKVSELEVLHYATEFLREHPRKTRPASQPAADGPRCVTCGTMPIQVSHAKQCLSCFNDYLDRHFDKQQQPNPTPEPHGDEKVGLSAEKPA